MIGSMNYILNFSGHHILKNNYYFFNLFFKLSILFFNVSVSIPNIKTIINTVIVITRIVDMNIIIGINMGANANSHEYLTKSKTFNITNKKVVKINILYFFISIIYDNSIKV